MDFTIKAYRRLIDALLRQNYHFATFAEYLATKPGDRGKIVVMRHDVDLKPQNSLITAKVEHEAGAKATYYFRAVPESWDETVIREIACMGHEVGYHYESLTTLNGDVKAAYKDFCQHLEELQKLVPVQTICMHGSPRSPYDSKDIWKKYDYKPLGIIGEPYLDTDFSKMLYLTDTGRRWDGFKVSVRDKIEGFQDQWEAQGWMFHSTNDIIEALQTGRLSNRLMITTHPQRWTDNLCGWSSELLVQNAKNIVKRVLIMIRKS